MIMKFIYFWNKFFFKRSLNVFDFLTVITVNALIMKDSWWYVMLYPPLIIVSVLMENMIDKNTGVNDGATTMV
jgi:hypothetical protein